MEVALLKALVKQNCHTVKPSWHPREARRSVIYGLHNPFYLLYPCSFLAHAWALFEQTLKDTLTGIYDGICLLYPFQSGLCCIYSSDQSLSTVPYLCETGWRTHSRSHWTLRRNNVGWQYMHPRGTSLVPQLSWSEYRLFNPQRQHRPLSRGRIWIYFSDSRRRSFRTDFCEYMVRLLGVPLLIVHYLV
jgi:hypothetical protein